MNRLMEWILKMELVFSMLCDAHINMITANERLGRKECFLTVDNKRDSLVAMRNFQLYEMSE